MALYGQISDMIADIERQAHLANRLIETETGDCSRANARGIAFAYDTIVRFLREAEIGQQPCSVKPLAECR